MQDPRYGTLFLFLCQANIEFFLASAPLLLTCLSCLLTAGLHDELSQIQLDSSSYSNEFPEELKKIALTQHYAMLMEVILGRHPVTFYRYSNDKIGHVMATFPSGTLGSWSPSPVGPPVLEKHNPVISPKALCES